MEQQRQAEFSSSAGESPHKNETVAMEIQSHSFTISSSSESTGVIGVADQAQGTNSFLKKLTQLVSNCR